MRDEESIGIIPHISFLIPRTIGTVLARPAPAPGCRAYTSYVSEREIDTMEHKQGSQGGAMDRPDVLLNASETQIEELERQFSEQDRSAWDTLVDSYGWTPKQGEAVWQWFSERAPTRQSWLEQGGGSGSGG